MRISRAPEVVDSLNFSLQPTGATIQTRCLLPASTARVHHADKQAVGDQDLGEDVRHGASRSPQGHATRFAPPSVHAVHSRICWLVPQRPRRAHLSFCVSLTHLAQAPRLTRARGWGSPKSAVSADDPYRNCERASVQKGRWGMTDSTRTNPGISLDELLADPLIRLIMCADKVDPAQVRELYRRLLNQHADTGGRSPDGNLDIGAERSREFRPCVGVMLLNRHDRVLVGRRTRTPDEAWQMPQGGIDEGEEPIAAALRELREEIGTDHVEVLAESNNWLRYELPPSLIGKAWKGRWRGQQQKWFAMRYLGDDAEINIATEHPEFSAWRWVSPAELPNLIVSFKRQVYLDVLHQFRSFAPTNPVHEETEISRIMGASSDPDGNRQG